MNTSEHPDIDETLARYERQIRDVGLLCEPIDYGSMRGLRIPFEFEKYELRTYVDDTQFIQFRTGYILTEEQKKDRELINTLAVDVTGASKGTTVVIDEDGDVFVVVEYFIPPNQEIAPTLLRTLRAIQYTVRRFFETLREKLGSPDE